MILTVMLTSWEVCAVMQFAQSLASPQTLTFVCFVFLDPFPFLTSVLCLLNGADTADFKWAEVG